MRNAAAIVLLIITLARAWPCAAQSLTANDRVSIRQAVQLRTSQSAAVTVQKFGGGYARVQVTMAGTDPALVYVHKENGRWRVVAGPGTHWSPAELSRLGIPPAVR